MGFFTADVQIRGHAKANSFLVIYIPRCYNNGVPNWMSASFCCVLSKGAFSPTDATHLNQTVWLSRVVDVFTPKDPTHQNCLVELSRIVAAFTPKDATRLNCLVASRLSVWTRLRLDTTSFHQSFRFWTFEFLASWVESDRKHDHTKRRDPITVACSRDQSWPSFT